jgi:phage portal protein BeeE
MPWYARIEQSADVALLTDEDLDAGYYTKFRERALLRGAMKDHAEYLTKLKNAGIISANEARWELDRNPVAGGDELSVASAAPKEPAPQGDEDPSAGTTDPKE